MTVDRDTTAAERIRAHLDVYDQAIANDWVVEVALEYAGYLDPADLRAVMAELAKLEELGIERHAEMLIDEVRLRSLEIRNGGFKMELAEARDLAAIYVACARTMLGNAENYTETPIEFHVKVAEQPELYILTVQRTEPHKLTPHQARQHAETERDQALAGHRKMRETLRSVAEELEELPEICRHLVGPRCGEAVDRAREARRLVGEWTAPRTPDVACNSRGPEDAR